MTLTNKQFNTLYKTYYSKISRYVSSKINNKDDAKELVEDVFIKVSQSYHLFDETKSQLGTWIYNIAKNVLIDYFRKKKLVTVSINTDQDEDSDYVQHVDIADSNLNPLDSLIQNDGVDKIMAKFDELSELEKTLMTMYAVQGLSYNQIVEELNIPLGTVKGTIHRARNYFRESFPHLQLA